MVITVVAREIFKQVGKQIYRAVNVQDRLLDKAWSYGRFNRSIRKGVRHGLAGGAAIGTYITQAPDSPGNGVQAPFRPKPPTGKSYQARGRQSGRFSSKYRRYCRPSKYRRRSNSSSSYRR